MLYYDWRSITYRKPWIECEVAYKPSAAGFPPRVLVTADSSYSTDLIALLRRSARNTLCGDLAWDYIADSNAAARAIEQNIKRLIDQHNKRWTRH